MRRKKVDSQQERQFLIALVTSDEFLAQASPVLDLDLLETDHFKQIAKWCLNYYQEYRCAPKQNLTSIYYGWAENRDEDDLSESVHDFLEDLNEEFENQEELNVAYLIDHLGDFLNRRKLVTLKDQLEYNLSDGNIKEAEQAVIQHKTVHVGHGEGINLLNDEGAWDRAFKDPLKPMLVFGGAAGMFFNEQLTRDALIGIQAPEKRGKTWMCVEMVMRALRNRKKVALFEVGDLSESQIMLRLGVRLTGLPLRNSQCGKILVPCKITSPRNKTDNQKTEMEEDQEENFGDDTSKLAHVAYKEKNIAVALSKEACLRSIKKFTRGCGIPENKTYIQISIHANSTVNIRDINGILERWEVEKEFVPDVIIIDYADILAPENPSKDSRDQVNETWKAMRRLSQERHCLVITPTQADAKSYEVERQSMKNFSEDKRKLAHVTGMFGLNQTAKEKEKGIMRLNWIVLRESEFSTERCLYLGQCLTLGKVVCCSAF